jgi:hypothetical protein
MKPIQFKEVNVVFAKNQPPYIPLPAYQDDSQGGRIFHCWKLTIGERIKILFTGKIWIKVLNFKKPPQPIRPMVDTPFLKKEVSIKDLMTSMKSLLKELMRD